MDRLFTISAVCVLIALVASWLAPGRWRPFLYLVASFIWWGLVTWYGLLCLLAVHLITFLVAFFLGPDRSNRVWQVVIGIALVIAPLLAVKLSALVTADAGGQLTQWVTILGISYYTFQCVGYLLDLHWENSRRLNLSQLLLLGAFFPRATVGPIERAGDFAGELEKVAATEFTHRGVRYGVFLVTAGLFMKLVLAERLVRLVTKVHEAPEECGILASGAAILIFPWQLYYDFAGYTFIALGFARILGIRLTNNFNRPLFATTVSDFWKRWHISLSSWFSDYVYTPFRFKMRRRRTLGIIVPTVTSFVFIGLWHEISILFVTFGLCHGTAVAAEALLKVRGPGAGKSIKARVVRCLWVGGTFLFVAATLVFFRAENLAAAGSLAAGLLRWMPGDAAVILQSWNKVDMVILVLFAPALEWFTRCGLLNPDQGEERLDGTPRILRWALYALLISSILVFGVYNHSPFIYAKF